MQIAELPIRDYETQNNPELFKDTTAMDFEEWLEKTPIASEEYADVLESNGANLVRVLDGLARLAYMHSEWDAWRYSEWDRPRSFTPTFIVPGLDTVPQQTRLHIAHAVIRASQPIIHIEKVDTTDPDNLPHNGQEIVWSRAAQTQATIDIDAPELRSRLLTPQDNYWQSAAKIVVTAHATLSQL